MSDSIVKPVYCHDCGTDVSGVGFCYHIDLKVRCHECTNVKRSHWPIQPKAMEEA